MIRDKSLHIFSVLALVLLSFSARADSHEAAISKALPDFLKLITTPAVIDAITKSNSERVNLAQQGIDDLEKTWQSQRKAAARPLIDTVVKNAIADHLRSVLEGSAGAISEINLMDAKGLSIAQTDQNSDIWQGDESKYQKSFAIGPDAVFIDELEFDSSTKSYQSQANATIVDPKTGTPIGAVSVGFNVEHFL
jgi:hypothetical protein